MKYIILLILILFSFGASSQQVYPETIKSHAHLDQKDRMIYRRDSVVKYTPDTGKIVLNLFNGVITVKGTRYLIQYGYEVNEDGSQILKQYIASSQHDTVSIIIKVPKHPDPDYQLMVVIISSRGYDFYKMVDEEKTEL